MIITHTIGKRTHVFSSRKKNAAMMMEAGYSRGLPPDFDTGRGV
jgi:hypothetical protein